MLGGDPVSCDLANVSYKFYILGSLGSANSHAS